MQKKLLQAFKKISFEQIILSFYLFFIFYLFFDYNKLFTNTLTGGDAMLTMTVLRGFLNNQFFYFENLGWPFEANWLSFFQTNLIFIILSYFVTIISKDIYFSINFIISLSYLLIFLLTLYFSKNFFLNNLTRILFSLAFALAPFHFYRAGGHIEYCYYIAVPILFYLFQKILNRQYKENIFYFYFFIIGISGIYFVYFSLILIIFLMIFLLLNNEFQSIKFLARYMIFLVLGALLSISPILFNEYQNYIPGLTRHINETEFYSQKILNWILPHASHKILLFQKISSSYHSLSPLTEQRLNSFGTIGTIGFIFSLLNLVIFNKNITKDKFKYFMSVSIIFIILFSMTGGFGVVFNFLISENFRAISRVSIFANFIALFFFFVILEKNIKILKITSFILPLIIFIDHIPSNYFGTSLQYEKIKKLHEIRKDYFEIISKNFKHSKTYVYPRIKFPEEKPSYREQNYTRLLPYIYNSNLFIDYGGFKTNTPEVFYLQFENKDPALTLKNLINCGFDSVLVTTKGVPKNKDTFHIYLKENFNKISSKNLEFEFFKIDKIKLSKDEELCDKSYVLLKKGFFSEEKDGIDKWSWSRKNSFLEISLNIDKKYFLQFDLQSLVDNEIKISSNFFHKNLKKKLIAGKIYKINIPLKNNQKNIDIIKFQAKDDKRAGDLRKLGFRLINLKLTNENL